MAEGTRHRIKWGGGREGRGSDPVVASWSLDVKRGGSAGVRRRAQAVGAR
jgi:hypothetical protein